MSTGRHAKKRAAKANEKYQREQKIILDKEERTKKTMEADVENQRIATMRSRFGGQAPDVEADSNAPKQGLSAGAGITSDKFKTPNRLKNSDPMRKTIMGMMLENPNNNGQG